MRNLLLSARLLQYLQALSLLYDNGLLSHGTSEVVFGSDFPHDDSDLQIIMNLQRIRKCMSEGRTVVLVHSRDGFFETLYDLLNQNYTEFGGQLYARLAFGTSYVLCPLVEQFRVVVVVDQADAYTKLAPPLLNRFEKQVLTHQHLLTDDQRSNRVREAVRRLKAFAHSFAAVSFVESIAGAGAGASVGGGSNSSNARSYRLDGSAAETDPAAVRDAFCGFHKDMLLSLAQSMDVSDATNPGLGATAAITSTNSTNSTKQNTTSPAATSASAGVATGGTADVETALQLAIQRLLWCATPEAACKWVVQTEVVRSAAQRIQAEFAVDVQDIYFRQQHHSNLPTFVSGTFGSNGGGHRDADSLAGASVMVLTFAPFHHDTAGLLNSVCPGVHASELELHQLSSQHDLRGEVARFLRGEKDVDATAKQQLLVVQCDPVVASAQRIEHAKYIVEQELALQHATNSPAAGTATTVATAAAAAVAAAAAAAAFQCRRRHVLLLVHLPRGQAGQAAVAVDFNKRWQYAFVDAIDSGTSGLPDLGQLLAMQDRSMKAILTLVDMRRLFSAVFRGALANLQLPFRVGTEYYDVKIRMLQQLVKGGGNNYYEDENDDEKDGSNYGGSGARSIGDGRSGSGGGAQPAFLRLLRDTLRAAMEKENSALHLNTFARRDLLIRGTFQNCLHAQIMSSARRALAVTLAHAERNSGLDLIDPAYLARLPAAQRRHLRTLWYRLFRRTVAAEIASQAATAATAADADADVDAVHPQAEATAAAAVVAGAAAAREQRIVAVKMDTRQSGFRFQSRFPFSFEVARLVELQRQVFLPKLESEPLPTVEATLRGQMQRLHRLRLGVPTGHPGEHGGSSDDEKEEEMAAAGVASRTAEQAGDTIEDKLPSALLDGYFHDFVAMQVLNDAHHNVDMEGVVVPVVRHVLLLATGQPATHASDFHVRFWKHEKRVLRLLRLLHVLPPSFQAAIRDNICGWTPPQQPAASIGGSGGGSGSGSGIGVDFDVEAALATDAAVELHTLQLVLQALEALAHTTPDEASPAEWVETLSRVDEDVPAVLEGLLARYGKGTTLGDQARLACLRWEKLALQGVFLMVVLVPQEATFGPTQAQALREGLWAALTGGGGGGTTAATTTTSRNMRSQACFHGALEVLQKAISVVQRHGFAEGMKQLVSHVVRPIANNHQAPEQLQHQQVQQQQLHEKKQQQKQLAEVHKSCARFLDVFLSDFVFGSPILSQRAAGQAMIEPALLQSIIQQLAMESMSLGGTTTTRGDVGSGEGGGGAGAGVSLPESSRLALMRAVLDMTEATAKQAVDEFLLHALPRAVALTGFLDASLCVTYTFVRETMVAESLMLRSSGRSSGGGGRGSSSSCSSMPAAVSIQTQVYHNRVLALGKVFSAEHAAYLRAPPTPTEMCSASGKTVRATLDAVALARVLYNLLADALTQQPLLGTSSGGGGPYYMMTPAGAAVVVQLRAASQLPVVTPSNPSVVAGLVVLVVLPLVVAAAAAALVMGFCANTKTFLAS
jgi:hypothetical protein